MFTALYLKVVIFFDKNVKKAYLLQKTHLFNSRVDKVQSNEPTKAKQYKVLRHMELY